MLTTLWRMTGLRSALSFDPLRARPWRRSVLNLIVILVCPGVASADEMRIVALALAPIPAATTVEIRPPANALSDDLGLLARLSMRFTDELTRMNYEIVTGDGELILRFSPDEPAFADLRPAPDLAEARPKILAAVGSEQADAESLRLRVSVSRHGRPPLWTGFAEQTVTGADHHSVFVKMATGLMAYWGKTYPKTAE